MHNRESLVETETFLIFQKGIFDILFKVEELKTCSEMILHTYAFKSHIPPGLAVLFFHP